VKILESEGELKYIVCSAQVCRRGVNLISFFISFPCISLVNENENETDLRKNKLEVNRQYEIYITS
jgi:hypothetical protein